MTRRLAEIVSLLYPLAMQLLSIAVALGALGFTFALLRSRGGGDRYGIVLVVLPLALVTPLVALMASGLQLIYAYRGAGSIEGLEALANAVSRAADTQHVGHLAVLALLGALALVAIALLVSRDVPRGDDAKEPADASAEPKALLRYAIPLMSVSVFVCITAVTTLSEFEDQFIAAPMAFVLAFDANDVSEFSSSRRAVDDQKRLGSNMLVVETFRTLVVIVLFLVLFDAFLVGSRSATFARGTLLLSIALIVLASALSVRAFNRQRAFRLTIEEHLASVTKAKADLAEASAETEDTEPPEGSEVPD